MLLFTKQKHNQTANRRWIILRSLSPKTQRNDLPRGNPEERTKPKSPRCPFRYVWRCVASTAQLTQRARAP